MPAPKHERRVFTYTTAPADYDWFGSKTVSIAGHDKRGRPIRLVSSDPQHAQAQRERYMSGLHMAVDDTEWEKLVKYDLVKLNKNPIPQLTGSQSRARVAELRGMGCKVKYAKLPNGDTAVLKKCPPGVRPPPLLENPAGGGLVTVALLAAAAVGAWLVFRKEPAKKSCPSFEQLGDFGKALKYNVWYTDQPLAAWTAAKPQYLADPKAKAYSSVECSFFKWTGSSWIVDNDTNAELAAYLKPTNLSGAPHPFVGLTVPK